MDLRGDIFAFQPAFGPIPVMQSKRLKVLSSSDLTALFVGPNANAITHDYP